MRRIIIAIILLGGFIAKATGQTYSVDKHIGIEDGLSNNFIQDIVIDKRGFVWVATESGLNRIAGNTVNVFNKQNIIDLSKRGIISNEIRTLLYDPTTDRVLMGLERGLSVYDCGKGVFNNFTCANGLSSSGINDIAAAADGGAWLMMVNGTVQHFNSRSFALKELRIDTLRRNRCGYDDGHGHLYLGHISEGLTIVDLSNNHTRHIAHQPGDAASLPGNNVRCIYQDWKGHLWVGTDHGLALYDPATGRFRKVMHQNRFADDNVFTVRQLHDGLLWVTSDMGGISFVNPADIRDGEDIYYLNDRSVSLSSLNTRCITQDEFGNIWIGNHSTGIDIITANKPLFSTIAYYDNDNRLKRIYGVSSDSDGNVWLGGEDEFSLYRDGRVVKSWDIGCRKRQHSFVMCLLADHRGNIWLGMEDEGIIRFNTRTQQFERLEIGHSVPDIRSLMEDRNGKIWIGSEFGLASWENGKVSREEAISQLIKNDLVSSILELNGNQMLLTTLGRGIYIVDIKKVTAENLNEKNGLPSYCVNHAVHDGQGGVWLATYEGLVHLPDLSNLKDIRIYNQDQGLNDNHIRALQTDLSGRMWLSTNTGISCFDTKKERFYNYNHLNNLPSGSFIGASAATTPDGTMYFGSPNGVCYFSPQQLTNDLNVSDVQIVSCEAYNPTGEDTEILSLLTDEQGRVRTTYQQNTLRITFTVKDYSQVDNVEYSYMMKGLNDQWYYIGNDHDVVFRGLRPGNYTFILRAKLKNQDWEEASVTQFDIRIAPPFWRTWWAYLIYLLLLSAVIWYLQRSYLNRLKLKNSLELERRENLQKQELNEERLRFFTNITHELRTPLTLILGPLEDLVSDKHLPEFYKKKVGLINKSAGRLRDLINEILEFRKTETQNRRLTVAKGDLGALVNEIGQNFKQLNNNPKMAIHINVHPDIPSVYFDSEIITTILNNLLSNSIKYTPEGSVDLIMLSDDKRVTISVKDTGYGIDKESLPHIFDRYYQAKGKHQASGTGIGLALVKSLVELHEGTIAVASELGKGSKFTFSILKDNTYPGALHKEDDEEAISEELKVISDETGENDGHPLLLVVEDNDDIRQYIADSMGDDYKVIQASDGQDGVRLALEQIPDIIVSDIMMPKMNGIELTRQLKEDVRTSHIPIILLTAKDSIEDKEEGYDSGADSYLTKPFSARLLQSRIQNLLSNRRRLAELITFRGSHEPSDPIIVQDVIDEPQLNRLDQEFIDKLNRIIEDNITTEDLDMAFMTDKMAMSHSTFYRKVKALTGMSAKEYIRKLRLQRCAELLRIGDYNVTEAANMTGFNDLGHFREVFKQEFGVAPSEYAKRRG